MKTKIVTLFVLLSFACFAQDTVKIAPKDFFKNPENLRLVTEAKWTSFEEVAIKPKTEIRMVNGHIETKEIEYFMWDGVSPLKVTRGPIQLPEPLATSIKMILNTPYVYEDIKLGCGYSPIFRFTLDVKEHLVEIVMIDCYDSFALYIDRQYIGSRPGLDLGEKAQSLKDELRALLNLGKEPNKALVPTPASVTSAAGAPVAPDAGAAHL